MVIRHPGLLLYPIGVSIVECVPDSLSHCLGFFLAFCPVVPLSVHVFILFWSVFQPCDLKILILLYGWLAGRGIVQIFAYLGEIYNKMTNRLRIFRSVDFFFFLIEKRKIETQTDTWGY